MLVCTTTGRRPHENILSGNKHTYVKMGAVASRFTSAEASAGIDKDAARVQLLQCAAIFGPLHLWILQDRCQGRQIRMSHSHSSEHRWCSLHHRCCCHPSATCALQRSHL